MHPYIIQPVAYTCSFIIIVFINENIQSYDMSSEGAGPVLAVVAADRLPVSEASLCPGSLSALVGVHPELEKK